MINSVEIENYLKASPNPFSNNIIISYSFNNISHADFQINLIEVETGKIVAQKTSTKNLDVMEFDTNIIASGVYVINVRNGSTNLGNIKVINIK